MLIHRVELDNVKSFEHAVIHFQPGVTAIVGPNGAGKSTILEAVGYALFGAMPHRPQVRFMRHGASAAVVKVTFTSPRDDRVYRVERTMRRTRSRASGALADSAATTVSLVDDALGRAIDQPAAELEDWLAAQLGVEGLTSPADLFEHVVGVPQGRLTADFLDAPGMRKARFDPVLRTTEFQQAVERLRPLVRHFDDQRREVETRAAHLEGRLAAAPEIRRRLDQARAALAAARAAEDQARQNLAAANDALAAHEARRAAREASERAWAAAAERRQHALARRRRAAAAVDDAHAAALVVANTRQAHLDFETARQRAADLAAADRRAQELQQLRERLHARRLRAVDELDETRGEVGPHPEGPPPDGPHPGGPAAAASAADLDASFLVLRRSFRQAQANAIARTSEARSTLAQAREDARTLRAAAQERVDQAERAHAAAAARLAALAQHALLAAQLEPRLAQRDALRQERAEVRAFLDADRHAQRMLQDTGACPFFASACLNLAQAVAVGDVFQRRAVEREERLAAIQTAIADAGRAVAEAQAADAEARTAAVVSARRNDIQTQMQTGRAAVALTTALTNALEAEDAPALEALHAAAAQAADQTAAPAGVHAEVRAAAGRIAGRAAQALRRLRAPADAQTTRTGARLLAAARRRAAQAAAEVDRAAAQLRALHGDLSALAQARAVLESNGAAHARFLKHEVVAGRLDACAGELDQARRAADDAQAAQHAAAAELETARRQFDAAALLAARRTRDDLLRRGSQLRERAQRLAEDAARLDRDRAALRQARADLETCRADHARLTRLADAAEFIRTVLRQAGPIVTEALLAGISDTADEIYGDIMGAPGGQLRWAADYEIVLSRGSVTRSFPQLSGGEQMAAALAVRLALLRGLLDVDLAFFDEPTQHLDAERRENLARQILAVRGFRQLIVISHDDAFERHVDHVIRVSNVGQTSRVENVLGSRKALAN